jgi:lysozyme family protein
MLLAIGAFTGFPELRFSYAQSGELLSPESVRSQLQALEKAAAGVGMASMHRAPLPKLTADTVYLETLPRLVELVDRSASGHPELAAQAASLLNTVHTQERSLPAFFLPRGLLRAAPPPFQTVQSAYESLFANLSVQPEHVGHVKWHVDRLIARRQRYEAVTAPTKVPWYVIGVLHALEASFNFLAHLHNGDTPLEGRTRHVPANRPDPWDSPFTWERSAEDALKLEHFSGLDDWSLARTLYRLEGYNGFGYRSKKVNTPYLWSFSTAYIQGKYIEDNKWSATAKSQQCGAAVMLHELNRRNVITLSAAKGK